MTLVGRGVMGLWSLTAVAVALLTIRIFERRQRQSPIERFIRISS